MKKLLFAISIVFLYIIVKFIVVSEGVPIYAKNVSLVDAPLISQADFHSYIRTKVESPFPIFDVTSARFIYEEKSNVYYTSNIEFVNIEAKFGSDFYRLPASDVKGRYDFVLIHNGFYELLSVQETKLPLININFLRADTKKNGDEENIMIMQVFDVANQNVSKEMIVLNQRGATSMTYPKKSYTIKTHGSNIMDLLGLGQNNKYVLNSLYEDDSKLRDQLSWDLWSDINKDKKYQNNVRVELVEVIIDGQYEGLYGLYPYINQSILNINDNKGEIYKILDHSLPNSNHDFTQFWGGIELEYTNKLPNQQWEIMIELVENIREMNSKNYGDFIYSNFDVENLISYNLFVQTINAVDNLWKNTFISDFEDRYVVTPWDLDITWGYRWTGELPHLVEHDENAHNTEIRNMQILNKLYYSNYKNINSETSKVYKKYREEVLNVDRIIDRIEYFDNILKESDAKERDRIRWPDTASSKDVSNIIKFIKERIHQLDRYYSGS